MKTLLKTSLTTNEHGLTRIKKPSLSVSIRIHPWFKILSFLLSAVSFCPATPVMFPLAQMFGGTNYTKPFTVSAQLPTVTDGTNIYVGASCTVTPSGGTNPVVQLTPNNYLIKFADSSYPWRISVPLSGNVQNALQLTSTNRGLPLFSYVPALGLLSLGSGTYGSNSATAAWMLGVDNSGNVTTNPMPTGGGGGNVNAITNNNVGAVNLINTNNNFSGSFQWGLYDAPCLSSNGYFQAFNSTYPTIDPNGQYFWFNSTIPMADMSGNMWLSGGNRFATATGLWAGAVNFGTLPLAVLPGVVVTNNQKSVTLGNVTVTNAYNLNNPALGETYSWSFNNSADLWLATDAGNTFIFSDAGNFKAQGNISTAQGEFTGNGGGLTNVPASQVTGTLPLAVLPGVVVTNTLVPNGTNDSSLLIQAAFNVSGSVCNFTPGDYYATNLWVNARNIMIEGHGATIHQLSAGSQIFWRTNTQWYQYTNYCFLINAGGNTFLPNIRIYDLNLDGQQPANYYTLCSFPLYVGTIQSMYALDTAPAAVGNLYATTNNMGLVWNDNCGGCVVNCTARNFGGVGFFVVGMGQSVPYAYGAGNQFYGNTSVSNFCGFYIQEYAPAYEYFALQPNFGNPEYAIMGDLSAACCAFGINAGPSNFQLHDSSCSEDYIGLLVHGSDDNNGPHSMYSQMKLNHDYCGFYLDHDDYAGLNSLYEAATVTNIIQQSGATFNGGCFGGVGIYNDSNTNQWTAFIGTEISAVTSFTNNGYAAPAFNNVMFQNCSIWGKCWIQSGVVFDLNNSATRLTFTNWTTDVITNVANAATYYGSGMVQSTNGIPSYFGNYFGNASGLTNIPASSLTGAITNSQITVQQFNGYNANYAEINIQNWSSAGSADLTATADNGNAVTNYFNAGINGSRYVPGAGVLGSTNDTYLLSVGRNSFYDLVGGGNTLYIVSQLTTNGTVSTNFTFTQSGNLTIAGSYAGSGSGLSSVPDSALSPDVNKSNYVAGANITLTPSGNQITIAATSGGGSANASTNVSQYWPSPQNLTNTANVLAGNGTAITNLYAVGTARFYTPLAIGATNSFGAAYIVATNFTSMSGRTNLWTANMPAGLFTNLAIGHLEAVYAVNQVNGVEAWGQLLTNGVPAGQWTGGYVDSIRGGPFTAGCDLRATNISVSFEVSAPGASSISGTNFSLTLTMTPLQ